MTETQQQFMDVLDFLKKSDVPCKVTFFYPEETEKGTRRGKIPINLDDRSIEKIDQGVQRKTEIPHLDDSCLSQDFLLYKRTTWYNVWKIDDIKRLLTPENITNQKRSTRLKDILSDPNPPTQVPV